ncbi:TSC22 domain family protein 2-like isoform X2 [Epinephelus fuscoguttatus]|uniref:TSC22 domain family protein 2-like isoform X2 n=1 Tax=Epinephelus fuscoguttatus TaxID=293821 RepID=UPI0020D10A53|nr:TSC22 domain family protein 2-like isoform X2 [Epinephelus fuscoguttatus]
MSKMPAKKKSCFQITSVTQAQVAAIGAADDTESLDDPDESRTEDVSSEIYDMSRAEYEPACDRSSSEEALNNVGETEAISVMAPSHIPQVGQVSALSGSAMGEYRKVGVSGSTQGGQQQQQQQQQQQPPGIGAATGVAPISQPGAMQQQPAPATSVSVNTSQPAAVTSSAPAPATSIVSCTSRFRVIKLDHGTGEPFRRGRWTCTEFYEKDSEGSAVSRTVDSIRHASATALDPAADRDSGIGQTGGSVVAPATHSGQGLGSVADASVPSSRMHSVETPPQQQQQIQHPHYSARQQGVSGSATQSAFSSSKPVAVPAQPTVGLQPSAPQGVLPVGQNGLPQPVVHIQKSPIMPPTAQTVTYPPQQQQLPMGHHLTGQSSGLLQNQTEYYQQQQPGLSTGQSAGPQPVGQAHAPVLPPASGAVSLPSQVGDVAGAGVGSVPPGQPAAVLLQQQTGGMGGVGGSMLVGGSAVGQYTAAGQPQPHGLHPASSGVQNVPASAVSSSVPTTVPTAVPSASSAAMPNVTTSSLPPGQIPHSRTLVALGAQGLPAAGFGHGEGGSGAGVGKSEGLVNAQSPVVSGKEPVKPLMPESLQLATPTVNSLFGIHIPVDGDVDRASGTNVAAIDNKIEQAMDLVKSHLMYAVREEVEVLKEQIKELFERNSVLERENAVLKSLANSEQLSQLPAHSATSSGATPPQQGLSQPQQQAQPPLQAQPQPQSHPQLQHHPKPQQIQTQPQLDPGQQQMQPNVTSA